MKRLLILLVLFAVILAGCRTQAEEFVPIAFPASTDAPTVQPTSLPAATNTGTPQPPTTTPEPTQTATVRSPNEPELIAILQDDEIPFCSFFVFRPDSKILALGSKTVRLWDISTFEITREFEFQDPDREFSS